MNPLVFDNFESLQTQLKKDISSGNPKYISVDGKDGVGKTTLSNQISANLNCRHIILDEFIEKNKGQYASVILRDKLLTNLAGNFPIIIDGICVQSILESLNIKPDIKIYVKRIGEFEDWLDEHYFEYFQTPEEVFEKDKNDLEQFQRVAPEIAGPADENQEYTESIFHEIVRYHYKYKPHENANYIYNCRHKNGA